MAPAVYDMRYLKPLDPAILEEAGKFSAILTLEDGSLKGGLYSAVCEYFSLRSNPPRIKGLGIPDKFIQQDTQRAQLADCSLDEDSIYALLVEMMKNV